MNSTLASVEGLFCGRLKAKKIRYTGDTLTLRCMLMTALFFLRQHVLAFSKITSWRQDPPPVHHTYYCICHKLMAISAARITATWPFNFIQVCVYGCSLLLSFKNKYGFGRVCSVPVDGHYGVLILVELNLSYIIAFRLGLSRNTLDAR